MVRRNYCFRGWKKSHRQGILRKGLFAWLIHFVAFDVCWWIRESDCILSGSHPGERVLALQVKMWKRESVGRRSIYRKYTSWSWLQKRGTKFEWGRTFKHWSRGSHGQWFPETEYLRESAIFFSGTSGILPIKASLPPKNFRIIANSLSIITQWVPGASYELRHLLVTAKHTTERNYEKWADLKKKYGKF